MYASIVVDTIFGLSLSNKLTIYSVYITIKVTQVDFTHKTALFVSYSTTFVFSRHSLHAKVLRILRQTRRWYIRMNTQGRWKIVLHSLSLKTYGDKGLAATLRLGPRWYNISKTLCLPLRAYSDNAILMFYETRPNKWGKHEANARVVLPSEPLALHPCHLPRSRTTSTSFHSHIAILNYNPKPLRLQPRRI